jgi:hypothetical protein
LRAANGLWEVDARLVDTKTRNAAMAAGIRRAGEPVHEMLLRLVVDEQLNIIEAGSETLWMPYPAQCAEHGDAYSRLVGLNLLQGFRAAVKERLGGILGCTHLTEMTQVLPTAVIQAFAGEVIDHPRTTPSSARYRSNRCHGAARRRRRRCRTYYPRWYRPAPEQQSHLNADGARFPSSQQESPA